MVFLGAEEPDTPLILRGLAVDQVELGLFSGKCSYESVDF